ncbi:MAG: hypothetical protein H0X16_10600 [Chloroflexi bacterium]|nr:hypothetical protein [Chloroflexota bacterium]
MLLVAKRRSPLLQAGLLVLAAAAGVPGIWATLDPAGFYATFPASGVAGPGGPFNWLALFPPFNEHLIRDYGALNLGYAALLLWAALRPTIQLVRAALVAWLISWIPHAAFHLLHIGELQPLDAIGQTLAIIAVVGIPLFLLVFARSDGRPEQAARLSVRGR